MIISPNAQGTDEWKQDRLIIPTSSNFNKIVTSKGERSKQRIKYLYQKVGEAITGEPADNYTNSYMDLGTEREDEARREYEWQENVEIVQVGLCYLDEKKEFAASPDGLIGDRGGFENKNAIPSVQLERLEKGWKGTEHIQQVQGNLMVSERDWWDLQSYSRGFERVVIRFLPDYEFIKKLKIEIKLFNEDVQTLVEKYSIKGA